MAIGRVMGSWCMKNSTANRAKQTKPKKVAAPAVLGLVTQICFAHEAVSDEPIKKPKTASPQRTRNRTGWRKNHSSFSQKPIRWRIMSMRAFTNAVHATKSKKMLMKCHNSLLQDHDFLIMSSKTIFLLRLKKLFCKLSFQAGDLCIQCPHNCMQHSAANKAKQTKPKKAAAPAVPGLLTQVCVAQEAARDAPIKKPTTASPHKIRYKVGWRNHQISLSHKPARCIIMSINALTKAVHAMKLEKLTLLTQLQPGHDKTPAPHAPARRENITSVHFSRPNQVLGKLYKTVPSLIRHVDIQETDSEGLTASFQ
ncbi:unnamed protein product [Pocillopora meandrina]|uniref:Uncharacterized protein n=1 Tax=Pocillopora meandrina TaxID=46732 RepID=A0AAU9W1H0_9CNID|nr:unnamed protein product [Pocillopora meandrina]